MEARLTKLIGRHPKGMHIDDISRYILVENTMRQIERVGDMYETPTGWAKGIHPERIALVKAWLEVKPDSQWAPALLKVAENLLTRKP